MLIASIKVSATGKTRFFGIMSQIKTLEIKNRTMVDPVATIPIVNAYMRWILEAAEEVLGAGVLAEILAESKLQKLEGHYPPDNMQLSESLTLKDYANLSSVLINRYGVEGKDRVTRIGRIAAQPALNQQGKLLNFAARNALRLLPMSKQVKTVLDSIKSDVEKVYAAEGHSTHLSLEDRGEKWAYIDEDCACCSGKTANHPICWLWSGTLEESLNWLTRKEFKVEQVSCRAMGDGACVWEVDKKPV